MLRNHYANDFTLAALQNREKATSTAIKDAGP